MTAPVLTRARIATLVIAGPSDRLAEAVDIVGPSNEDASSLHVVRVLTDGAGSLEDQSDIATIQGLRPQYVNNAIAAVRLSSLPTVVWWRGGPAEGVDGVANLADRVVIDVDDPWSVWPRLPPLFEDASLTDIRWARLTRWRAAMAHFFDLPQIRDAAQSFVSLSVKGHDHAQCALFAGWLDAALGWRGRIVPACEAGTSDMPMESVTLSGNAGTLRLELLPSGGCLDTRASLGHDVLASRVVSLGDQSLRALLAEELRVRSRDLAFERALESALTRSTST